MLSHGNRETFLFSFFKVAGLVGLCTRLGSEVACPAVSFFSPPFPIPLKKKKAELEEITFTG